MQRTPSQPDTSIIALMPGRVLLMATLAVAACTDHGSVQPAASSDANAISFNGGKTVAVDVSPSNPSTDPRVTSALLRLRAMQGGSLASRRPAAWSTPPVYVVTPSLPAGVVYKVVRDPASASPRVILFSEATMTDDQLYRSVGRLALDELREPSPRAVRTITMYADNHFTVEYAGQTESRQVHDGMSNASAPVQAQGVESQRVLREAARGEVVTIAAGVRGRVFRPTPQ